MGLRSRASLVSGFCLGLVFACAPLSAAAQARLVYGADRAFAPFESRGADGKPAGFQIELLQEITRRGGPVFDIRQDEWAAIEAGFRAGRIDVVAMSATRSRREWALFTRAHATPATGIYHRRETRSPVALADLGGHVIAIVADSEPMRQTRESFLSGDEFRFLPLADVAAVFAAVRDGRADFALVSRAYGDEFLARGGAAGIVASEYSLRLQAYGFAVAPGNEALRVRLDALVEQLEADGTLEALRRKWLASHHDAALRANLERHLLREHLMLGAVVGIAVALVLWLAMRLRSRAARLRVERQRRAALERDLAAARQKLERAFTHHPDAMLVAGGGRIVEVNPALVRLFGRPREALVGRSFDDMPVLAGAGILGAAQAALEAHGYFENLPFEWRRDDGTSAYFLVTGQRVETGAAPEVLCIVREVSAALRDDAPLRREFEALLAAFNAQAAELEAKRRQARENEEALQGFTEAVSHDLRAPLRAIGGFAGMLRGDLADGDVESALSNAAQIENAVERMGSMLEGLTRLSRVGRAMLDLQEVDMRAEAERAWRLVTGPQPVRVVELRIAALPATRADPVLVAQVWQNLLENAWKFTARSAQATVAVDAHAEHGVTWYRVADNGAGFDMRHAQNLFQPFQRMHSQREFAGTGIGLSIVRRIVLAHGGDVRARSNPGVGTVIEFCLTGGQPARD